MQISGFSMVKNATELFYPVKESIASILPLVDEFVVAVGKGNKNDRTREEILSLNSSKISIIDTVWDLEGFPNGTENAHQTDIAKKACSGDWLFYLQADEVVHEGYLPTIEAACQKYMDDKEVEGFLFDYCHFWGDFWHYVPNHGWYPKEIRIIRNDPEIHSWRSAQSFRRIPNFDGKSYRQKEGTAKLKVAPIDAYIYHYGWVRPPHLMKKKKEALDNIHQSKEAKPQSSDDQITDFDYGDLTKLPTFKGNHPKVMNEWIQEFDWADQLKSNAINPNRPPFRHERWTNKLLTWFEQNILGGHQLFGSKNWQIVRRS